MGIEASIYGVMVVIFSVLYSVVSMSWIGVWVGMEINLYGSILLMVGSEKGEVGACLKYFLVQCFGSMVILMSVIFGFWGGSDPLFWVFVGGFSVKLGIPPFHFWVPEVVKGGDLKVVWFVFTVQKLVPLFSLCVAGSEVAIMSLLSLISVWVGSLGGLSASRLSGVLAYSSVLHGGWSLAACLGGFTELSVYLSVYWVVLGGVCWLAEEDCYVFEVSWMVMGDKFLMPLWSFLSLGGFPPTMGFFAKLLVLMSVMSMFPVLGVFLVVGSIFSWSYYLLVMAFFVMGGKKSKEDLSVGISLIVAFSGLGGLMFIPLLGV